MHLNTSQTIARALFGVSAVMLIATIWSTHRTRLLGQRSASARDDQQRLQTQLNEAAAAVSQIRQELVNATPPSSSTAVPEQSAASKLQMNDDEAAHAKAAAMAEARRRVQIVQLIQRERYVRPKFEQLGLSAADWASYEELQATLDRRLQTAGRASAEASAAREEFARKAEELVGANAYEALRTFRERVERSGQPVGIAVRELRDALRFSSTPLNTTQAEQLASILVAESGSGPKHSPPVLSTTGRARVAAILSPAQLEAWQRLQTVYSTTAELNELMSKHAAALKHAVGGK